MSKKTNLFDRINDAVLDLQSSSYQTFEQPITRLGRLLEHDDLRRINDELIEGLDVDAFIQAGLDSQSSMVGSGRLDWPNDDQKMLGMQLLVIKKFTDEPDYITRFAMTFYSSGSRQIIQDVHSVTRQLIIPFIRDYRNYVESNGQPETGVIMPLTRKIFIVHGHDEAARETVARFVEKLGFDAIILHEQANRGGTIIEKIEANRDVGFAVVLLTPDDLGKSVSDAELKPRARQNVMLELGYFMAHLGRDRVCVLKKGDVDIPSDYSGVVWESLDGNDGWKFKLARELKAAGHEIDLNSLA